MEMTKLASEEEGKEQNEPRAGEEEEAGLRLNLLAAMVRMAKDLHRVVEERDPQMLFVALCKYSQECHVSL